MIQLQRDLMLNTRYTDLQQFYRAFRKLTPNDLGWFTFSLFKPDFYGKVNLKEVFNYIENGGFKIIFNRPFTFEEDLAKAFYAAHSAIQDEEHDPEHRQDKVFFQKLIQIMTSGPCEFMFIGCEPKNNVPCYELWRRFIGPTDPSIGEENMPRKHFYQIAYPNDPSFSLFHSMDSTNGFHGPRLDVELSWEVNMLLTAMLLEAA